jgi:hypothetical protein
MRGSSQLFQSLSQFVYINLVFPIRDQGFAIALDEIADLLQERWLDFAGNNVAIEGYRCCFTCWAD